MSRVLAIDYGTKRSGIAVSDSSRIIATPLETVDTRTLLTYLEAYMGNNKVDCVIIGIPVDDRNKVTNATEACQRAFVQLKKKFSHIQIVQVDERYTSKIARQSIQQLNLPRKRKHDKRLVDKMAATIILQEYLDKEKNVAYL